MEARIRSRKRLRQALLGMTPGETRNRELDFLKVPHLVAIGIVTDLTQLERV